jgi:hypothetical protein
MPIREFTCSTGHTIERVLFGDQDRQARLGHLEIPSCPVCLQAGVFRSMTLQPISRTSEPQFVRGKGGFYKPTR